MSIEAIALILLLARVFSVVFIILVLVKQVRLLKLPISNFEKYIFDKDNIKSYRRVFFTLSVIILAGNVIPIIIDVMTLFIETGRPDTLRPISIMYALSNSFTAAASALMIWSLYKLSEGTLPPPPWTRWKRK